MLAVENARATRAALDSGTSCFAGLKCYSPEQSIQGMWTIVVPQLTRSCLHVQLLSKHFCLAGSHNHSEAWLLSCCCQSCGRQQNNCHWTCRRFRHVSLPACFVPPPVCKACRLMSSSSAGCGKSTFMRRMTSVFGGSPKPPAGEPHVHTHAAAKVCTSLSCL